LEPTDAVCDWGRVSPLFLQRLKDSLAKWDMRDGKADWTPPALAANANMFLDDFLLFDVTKPITDTSLSGDREEYAQREGLWDWRWSHCERRRHRWLAEPG
jgi:hypothetical protein